MCTPLDLKEMIFSQMKNQTEQDDMFCNPTGLGLINVASVPQRSPFRYPGGKTWLVPYIRLWLSSIGSPILELVEPFAGGGIVGLTAAFENLAKRVTLVELDSDVASVWRTILGSDGEHLADRLVSFRMTPENVQEALKSSNSSLLDRAFVTILRNRIQRGGILAAGAGIMKRGENGKGLSSRWYPRTLQNRILAIRALKGKMNFIHGDGVGFMKLNAKRRRSAYFIDPPYTVAGRRLYTHSSIDHEALFHIAKNLAGDFLMSYDNAGEIRKLASRFGFDLEPIPMKNTHHARQTELLISRNLDWVRSRQYEELASPGFLIQTFPD